MFNLRSVVFEASARKVVVDMYGDDELADKASLGVEYILARRPEAGTHIEGDVWMIDSEARGIWKGAVFFYTFDAERVIVQDVLPSDTI